jgi:ADP-ribose pyrophosphatase YjhB (NUDIX family)
VVSDIASDDLGPWLSEHDLDQVRRKVPILYVDIVPVRLADGGVLDSVGLILRGRPEGTITRELVSGRVLHQETVRQAIARHVEKDLGPLALPQIPVSPTPFTIGEYFPTPGDHFVDRRQHAVSLAYVVPVAGDCSPANDTLEVTWLTPREIVTPEILGDMSEGHAEIARRALAHLGQLP